MFIFASNMLLKEIMLVKRITAVLCFFLFPTFCSASLSEGPERDSCFRENASVGEAYDCLAKKKAESAAELDALIMRMNKSIFANNPGDFNGNEDAGITTGEVFSQRFLNAQTAWKQYRARLCEAVATEINEDAWDYHAYIDQCEITLNQRHAEEIRLMRQPD
ncbi:lysozyme inhibitor LprI family protein [Cronobacter dublinensis]